MIHDVGGVGKRDDIKDVSDGYALNFLIPNGRLDSRVNPAHSEKLLLALQNSDDGSGGMAPNMFSINNSGHWLASPTYQNIIGWRTNVIIWTRIFDFLGWKF